MDSTNGDYEFSLLFCCVSELNMCYMCACTCRRIYAFVCVLAIAFVSVSAFLLFVRVAVAVELSAEFAFCALLTEVPEQLTQLIEQHSPEGRWCQWVSGVGEGDCP